MEVKAMAVDDITIDSHKLKARHKEGSLYKGSLCFYVGRDEMGFDTSIDIDVTMEQLKNLRDKISVFLKEQVNGC